MSTYKDPLTNLNNFQETKQTQRKRSQKQKKKKIHQRICAELLIKPTVSAVSFNEP